LYFGRQNPQKEELDCEDTKQIMASSGLRRGGRQNRDIGRHLPHKYVFEIIGIEKVERKCTKY
jgi:hypothetical protein